MNQANSNPMTIQCNVKNTPAILERLLRTIRVRGFTLGNLEMKVNNQDMDIRINLMGERNLNMLINQLEKLVDVNHVLPHGYSDGERMSA